MAKKKKNKKKRSGSFKYNLLQQIVNIFDNNPGKAFNYKQLSNALGIRDIANKKLIGIILDELVHQGKLYEVQRGKYKLKSASSLVIGKVDMTARGAAYILVEDAKTDIFIHPKNTGNALNGDIVKVNIFSGKMSTKLEGEIVEVVERAKTEFVGIVQKSKTFAFLVPEDPKVPVDIFIANENLKGAKDGEKAIAKITEWPNDRKNPFGKIIEVLGQPGENETEMHAILAEYGLPYHFPRIVEKEANKLDLNISLKEIKKRRDFRTTTTFTIDPKDAKDFDDALSL